MDLIDRRMAIEHLKKRLYETALNNNTEHPYYEEMADNRVDVWMNEVPSAQPQRIRGKWAEKHHAYADEEKAIEEWQSCKCSVCGRYDTRPYLYYFYEPHFCSWCGADMRGGQND